MIVYLARAIQAFVMYCVNGTSRSSLLIESTDSMIILQIFFVYILIILYFLNIIIFVADTNQDLKYFKCVIFIVHLILGFVWCVVYNN